MGGRIKSTVDVSRDVDSIFARAGTDKCQWEWVGTETSFELPFDSGRAW